ncbi:MAG: redoxin domain-containing protein [Alphaproteobacteria bacterium]|nr:redoxin domain-containing protein [Alphaproteobacteria bacterium]
MARNSGETAFDFSLQKLTGGELKLKAFAGKPLLIVNTASKCGFTPQYAGLEEIWKSYKKSGLVVLGVPSNDFAGQEPGTEKEIAAFCETNYGVDFPMASKVHVSGSRAHPLFKFLVSEGGFLAAPRWNFYKYLVDRDGHLKEWFSSFTSPTSSRVKRAVESVIAKG